MPLRKTVFWVHLICGLAVGTVVLMMSVTGVMLTYEKQMEEWADREFWVAPEAEGRAPAGTLVANASAYAPDTSVRSIMYYGGDDGPAAASLRDGRIVYMDPSTGEVRGVGSVAVRGFFSDVMRWHRWFNVRDEDRAFARAITGWSNLIFLFLVLSGLYLWVPRRISWQHFRPVLLFNRNAKGKARDFNWHHVFGFWSAIPLALVVASASVISFPWASDLAYRVVGDEPPRRAAARPAPRPTAPAAVMAAPVSSASTGVPAAEDEPAPFDPTDLDPLIAPAMDVVDDWRLMTVTVPSVAGDPVSIRIDEGWGGRAAEADDRHLRFADGRADRRLDLRRSESGASVPDLPAFCAHRRVLRNGRPDRGRDRDVSVDPARLVRLRPRLASARPSDSEDEGDGLRSGSGPTIVGPFVSCKAYHPPPLRNPLVRLPAIIYAGALLSAVATAPLAAQNGSRPNVFWDCDGRDCNSQYYRTEIGWVNWVNDREVSDVHLIMTSQTTGANGREYQLDFIGTGSYEGYEDQILFQTLATDTERERLDGVTAAIGAGLARFGVSEGFRDLVTIQGASGGGGGGAPNRVVSQEEVDDPWNLWVFRLNGNTNLDGEESRSTRRFSGGFNASRVTPELKMNFNGNVNYQRREFELTSGTFVDIRTDWNFNPLVAYAIADHWSIGFEGQMARMNQVNQAFRAELTPGIEFSVFPYEEATRRALTFYYKVGPAYRYYFERTIYDQIKETRFEQALEIEFSQRQTWGDAGITLTGSHYLHDPALYNLSIRGDVEYRIVRGISVNARGNVGRVKDQIYLPAQDATDAQALLELQRRATSFDYGLSVGFSIQFGSIFNNVVNNRFRGAGGFFGGGGFGRFFR